MACERKPSYLRQTTNSLNVLFEVYFQTNKSTPFIKIEKKYDTPKQNSQYNYSECLKGLGNKILIEDDVVASQNLETYMRTVYKLLENKERYILSLYACYYWKRQAGILELIEYPKSDFYGTQAMMFDNKTQTELSKYIANNIGGEPYDFLIKNFAIENDITIYATTYSLFQHMGEITTGLGHHHKTNIFIDDFIQ